MRKVISMSLVVLLVFSLVSCGVKEPATSGSSPDPVNAAEIVGTNTEKAYSMAAGIADPALFIANENSEAGTGSFNNFAFEGLIRFQRGSDDIKLILAESFTHEGNKTIFKLRPNIKWNDGTDFTSKDIWAFYQVCHNTPVNYLESIETPDPLTVEFVWQDPAPFEELRIMLISQEIYHGRMPYHIYGKFADQRAALIEGLPLLTAEQKANGLQGPFGKDIFTNPEIVSQLDDIWKEYIITPPNAEHTLVGTGGYVNVPGHTMNEARMEKNPHYWNPEGQKFDTIVLKATTDATKSSMMKSEEIHAFGGSLPKDLADSLLASNKNIIYYPHEDPACHGLLFNIQSTTSPMAHKEFRQALIYIAQREAMRDIGSYQSKTHPWSMLGIPPSMLEKYVSQDVIDKMTQYSHDEEKATQLMESIGCKKENGKWMNPDGTPIKLTIGVDKDWYVATLVSPIYANQLNNFGIQTEVMAVDGTVYGSQSNQEHAFDMSWEWMDTAWSLSYPYFTLQNTYKQTAGVAQKINLPFDEATNVTTVELEDWNGETFNAWNWISEMQNEQDDTVRKDHWERIIWATNENAFGINFYQNVTAYWENLAKTDGLPMLEKMTENRWMPFPEGEEETIEVYNLNDGFSGDVRKLQMISPNTP